MNTPARCPCCSGKLIHHISHHRDYWFCRDCWAEMPIIDNKNDREDRRNYYQEAEEKSIGSKQKVWEFSQSSNELSR